MKAMLAFHPKLEVLRNQAEPTPMIGSWDWLAFVFSLEFKKTFLEFSSAADFVTLLGAQST
jgi:hypothetical protein